VHQSLEAGIGAHTVELGSAIEGEEPIAVLIGQRLIQPFQYLVLFAGDTILIGDLEGKVRILVRLLLELRELQLRDVSARFDKNCGARVQVMQTRRKGFEFRAFLSAARASGTLPSIQ